MLIIHPKDKTTKVLSRLYEGLDIRFVDQSKNNTEVKHILNYYCPLKIEMCAIMCPQCP